MFRCKDNNKMDLREAESEGVDWIQLSHVSVQWREYLDQSVEYLLLQMVSAQLQ
jgi:hypothetical protein